MTNPRPTTVRTAPAPHGLLRKSADRRQRPRAATRGRIEVRVDVDGHSETIVGLLRDLSRGGIGLTLPVPIDIGASLQFRALLGTKILSAHCRVANCRDDPAGGYLVGAELVSVQRSFECTDVSHENVDESQVSDVATRLLAALSAPIPTDPQPEPFVAAPPSQPPE